MSTEKIDSHIETGQPPGPSADGGLTNTRLIIFGMGQIVVWAANVSRVHTTAYTSLQVFWRPLSPFLRSAKTWG